MKKILFIFTVLSVLKIGKIKAQPFGVADTLAYIQTIANNKTFYIGKPFSVLMDSLKIQIRFFSPFASIPYAIAKETSTSFSFYFPQTTDDFYLSYPKLEIYWKPYLNAYQSGILWENHNGGGWSPAVSTFYANGIIADIKVRE